MENLPLKLAIGLACLCLASPLAMSGERVTGEVALTSASASCPAGLLAAGKPVAVNFTLPEGASGGADSRVTLAGEFRDFAVQGCTVAFSGGSANPLTYVSMDSGIVAHERGCRGYCGL